MVQDLIKEVPGRSEAPKLSRVTTEPRTANFALGQVILLPLMKSHTNETFAPPTSRPNMRERSGMASDGTIFAGHFQLEDSAQIAASQRGPRDFEILEKRNVVRKKEPVEVRMIRERITALDLDCRSWTGSA
jgi:hypothetical protein